MIFVINFTRKSIDFCKVIQEHKYYSLSRIKAPARLRNIKQRDSFL